MGKQVPPQRRFRRQPANRLSLAGEPIENPFFFSATTTRLPVGTLEVRRKVENGRLLGPGVLDMKSGIALILHAIERSKLGTAHCRARSRFSWCPRRSWQPFFAQNY